MSTHGDWITVPLEGLEGTAALRRRYRDNTLEVKLSSSPGVLFRIGRAWNPHYDRAIIVEGGDLDMDVLALIHIHDEADGTTSLHVDGQPERHYETYPQVIAETWPAFEARCLAEHAEEAAPEVRAA